MNSPAIDQRLRCILAALILTAVVGTRRATADADTYMPAMRDGTRLATSVYLPDGQGPWPVILARTPYGRSGGVHETVGAEANERGYVFVVQDLRGRGDSEGNPWIIFQSDGWGERQDGFDTVEWIAAQAWCNGKVGTWGASALGITQAMMAPSRPPHLKCQHIAFAFSNMYLHCAYQGGVWRPELLEAWLKATGMVQVNLATFASHRNYDNFWTEFDAVSKAGEVNAPALFIGGWYDCFSQGTIDGYVALQNHGQESARRHSRLIMGPWAHGKITELTYPENSRFPDAADHWRWFDQYLKADDRGLADLPRVCYYVMGDPEDNDAPGNEWRDAESWPPASLPTRYYLQSDGGLSTEMRSSKKTSLTFTFDPSNPAPSRGGANLTIPVGPMDQRDVEARPDVLVFTSEELKAPVEVTGRILARLWITSSAPDTDFTVKLCDVYPDGRSMLVTDGILRTRFRESFQSEKMLEPGEIYPIDVDLWSTSLIFNQGHRIRVSVSSSNFPRFAVNPNTGDTIATIGEKAIATNSVFMSEQNPSYIQLPVVRRQNAR